MLILLDDDFCAKHQPDVYLVNRGIHAEIEALRLTRILRSEKFSVELDNSGASFSKQFKRANRSAASWAIVIGEEELDRGEILLKSLRPSDESISEISIDSSQIVKLINIIKS